MPRMLTRMPALPTTGMMPTAPKLGKSATAKARAAAAAILEGRHLTVARTDSALSNQMRPYCTMI